MDAGREKKLQELSLESLGDLCGNVAHSPSVTHEQWETAYRLRTEYLRLTLGREKAADEQQLESLKKGIVEFLSGLPSWML